MSKVPQRRLSRGSTTKDATLTLSANGRKQRRISRKPYPFLVAQHPFTFYLAIGQQAFGMATAVNNERLANIGVERHA